jgi:hypothetical protein
MFVPPSHGPTLLLRKWDRDQRVLAAGLTKGYSAIHGRPDQLAPTERTEVYLNTTFSHWNVPIFLAQEKETSFPFVGHLHKPETALGMDQLLPSKL